MQKKSNNSISYPVALSGMNNILPADMVDNNKAVLLENVTYNETTKSFQGSKKYAEVNIQDYTDFTKIYEVIHNDKRNILLVNNNGFYDYNRKVFIPTSEPITDIVYNDDGVYLSFSNRVFFYGNGADNITEIPFSDILINSRTVKSLNTMQDISYLNGVMYCLPYTAAGLGYFKMEDSANFNTLSTSEHFTFMQGCFLVKYKNKTYLMKWFFRSDSDKSIGAYELTQYGIGSINDNLGLSLVAAVISQNYGPTTYPYSADILYYKDGELYGLARFNHGANANCNGIQYNKYITGIADYMCMGLHEFQLKQYDRLLKIKISFLMKGWAESGGGSDASKLNLITLAVIYDAITGEELSSTKTERHGKYIIYPFASHTGAFKININSQIVTYAVSDFNLLNIEKNFTCSFKKINIMQLENKEITNATQNQDKVYVNAKSDGIYEIDFSGVKKNAIPFMIINNARLVVAQTNSLYYSGVGDFNNWQQETDADALFLEVGYKDSGSIIAGSLTYGSIIIFKDNGYIYRVSGDYPNWTVTKIAETDNITSNIYNMGGTLLFGTKTGVKQINPTQVYGDFLLSDFQNNIIANEVVNISESQERKTIVFCSKDYVFEYHTQLNIFYVYQSEIYNQMLEFYDNGAYTQYALKGGKLYQESENLNEITVIRGLLHNQYNIVIKAITLYTDEIQKDTDIEIEFISGKKITRTLKAGQTKHKFFITTRIKELQLKYIHSGDIFINNTIIEFSTVGA